MRKNCSSVRKKIEKKVCKFEAVRPRICNVFEIFVPHTIEQFFSQLVRNIMVTDYFFVYSHFFQWIKKIIKNFWDMEIIGNIRKMNLFKRKYLKIVIQLQQISYYAPINHCAGQFWVQIQNPCSKPGLWWRSEIPNFKNKKSVQQCGFQKIWKILLLTIVDMQSWVVVIDDYYFIHFNQNSNYP